MVGYRVMFRITGILALLLGLAGLASAQKLGEVPRAAPSPSASKNKVLEWTSREGRAYWYRLPAKISRKKPPCLILMLHGTGLNHGWSFWNYPIVRGRFRPDDIVVSPDGLTPGAGGTYNFLQGKKDGDQIAGLIKAFKKRFPVSRVYLYGHSQGAFFCYWFAGAHPEIVDGIVAHAGNVLDVSHPKLAREKVAIGILHGKADAVVPVKCAYRTERIYKEQGYKKLKLYVVEGLTKRTGHWPLPAQVLEMFEWLDRVTVSTPAGAFAVAVSELNEGKPAPDLSVVANAAKKMKKLLKKYRGSDRAALKEKLTSLEAFLEDTATSLLEQIDLGRLAQNDPEPPEVSRASFRLVNRPLSDTPAWIKAARSFQASAKKQDKAVARALKAFGKRESRKTFAAAFKVLEASPLADGFAELRDCLARAADKPPKGVTKDQVDAFRSREKATRDAEAEARRQILSALTPKVASFRSEHPDLFPPSGGR